MFYILVGVLISWLSVYKIHLIANLTFVYFTIWKFYLSKNIFLKIHTIQYKPVHQQAKGGEKNHITISIEAEKALDKIQ